MPESRHGCPVQRSHGRWWQVSVLLLLLVLLGSGAEAQQTVRAADASCAACHAEIYRRYLKTPMANASGPALERLLPAEFEHKASGVRYQVERRSGKAGERAGDAAVLRYLDTRHAETRGEHRLEYFLGSGHLGTTYLYTQNGYLLESPVAWYAASASYDMKPGMERSGEMPEALPMQPGCLRCHMSGVAHAEAGTSNRYAGLAFQQTGITCEGCHGDASSHVRSGGRTALVNPAKLQPARRDAVCVSCHLEGDQMVEKPGRSLLDYRPGEEISNYVSYFVAGRQDALARGVSEVEQFAASRCKRVSGEGMSCTNCHDPHGSPAAGERVAFYRGKCLACHTAPEFTQGHHHAEQPDCTSCHMPRSTAQNIPHVAWTDHRILRRPTEEVPATMGGSRAGTLIPVLSPRADARDEAVALYYAVRAESEERAVLTSQAGLAGESAGLARMASEKLEAVYAAGARDAEVLEGLAVLRSGRGERREAEVALRELLRAAPLSIAGGADLGVLLAQEGDLEAAEALLTPVFSRNEDQMPLAYRLAVVQCARGEAAAARRTIDRALLYSPGTRQAREFACTP